MLDRYFNVKQKTQNEKMEL